MARSLDISLWTSRYPFQRRAMQCKLLFDNGSMQAFGILDVDTLHIAVEFLLGTFLVVTLAGDADSDSERDSSNTRFPDLLVQLRVETDVLGALVEDAVSPEPPTCPANRKTEVDGTTYHSLGSKFSNGLDCARRSLLEGDTMNLFFGVSLPSDANVKLGPAWTSPN